MQQYVEYLRMTTTIDINHDKQQQQYIGSGGRALKLLLNNNRVGLSEHDSYNKTILFS
jgi:hypothetical protein